MVIETGAVLISVVTPLFNEEDNIKEFYHKTSEVLVSLNKSYEIIFIDDGSKDRTYDMIKDIQIEDAHIRLIKFKKNRGQLCAFLAGFEAARGKIIITMDGDLQNDPCDIPIFLDKIEKGFDFVTGWRYYRKDSLERRLISKVSNWLTRKRTKVLLRDYGCAFTAIERRLIDRLRRQGGKARFIKPMLAMFANSPIEIKINHNQRKSGVSKYNLAKLVKSGLDFIFNFPSKLY